MKYNDLSKAIEKLEKELEYLHVDYYRMLNQSEAFNEIRLMILKIKQAEESLRLKKRILQFSHS